MKNCETCDYQYCKRKRLAGCGVCLARRGLPFWRPMGRLTRLRRWIRRLV